MDRASRAALFSALIFPGAGQCYLGFYRRGVTLMALALVPCWFLVTGAIRLAGELVADLKSGGVGTDLPALLEALVRALGAPEQGMQFAATALALLWVLGILDAHRLGQRQGRR